MTRSLRILVLALLPVLPVAAQTAHAHPPAQARVRTLTIRQHAPQVHVRSVSIHS